MAKNKSMGPDAIKEYVKANFGAENDSDVRKWLDEIEDNQVILDESMVDSAMIEFEVTRKVHFYGEDVRDTIREIRNAVLDNGESFDDEGYATSRLGSLEVTAFHGSSNNPSEQMLDIICNDVHIHIDFGLRIEMYEIIDRCPHVIDGDEVHLDLDALKGKLTKALLAARI